jgi:hypothetical protein
MKRYTVELSDRKRSRHVDAQFPSDAVVHVVGNRLHSKREAVRYPDGFTIFECKVERLGPKTVNKEATMSYREKALEELVRAFLSYLEDDSRSERRRQVCIQACKDALRPNINDSLDVKL